LQAGQHYAQLRPAISICLLRQLLLSDTPVPHHRFRLVDPEHGRELLDGIEVHTVELAKYNLDEATISAAPAIVQWAFFLLRADRYEASRLRELLPGEGKIQLLQQLLSEGPSAAADLRQHTLDKLNSLLTDLQQRLRGRDKL
jgi:hypothetical protein